MQNKESLVSASESFPPSDCCYWWLNANFSIWSVGIVWEVDLELEYTLLNDNGQNHRIYQNFLDVKSGDNVICYESTPTKQIVALAKVKV